MCVQVGSAGQWEKGHPHRAANAALTHDAH